MHAVVEPNATVEALADNDQSTDVKDKLLSEQERRSTNLVKPQEPTPRIPDQDTSRMMNAHRQLRRQSSEEKKHTRTSTLGPRGDVPEEESTIAGNAHDPELHPTKGNQKHLHPSHQKGSKRNSHNETQR
jgi:hypothetical protein